MFSIVFRCFSLAFFNFFLYLTLFIHVASLSLYLLFMFSPFRVQHVS